MAEKVNNVEEMIKEILTKVDGQNNFREVYSALRLLTSDVIVEGQNNAQDCYNCLVELGEQEIADKYIKPLI